MSNDQDNTPTTHLKYVVSALQLANRRGAFELNESGTIIESIKFFSTDNNNRGEEEQAQKLGNLVGMCRVAQKRGAFELEEAATLAPHVRFFLQQAEEENTNVNVDASAAGSVPNPQSTNKRSEQCQCSDCKCDPCKCTDCKCTNCKCDPCKCKSGKSCETECCSGDCSECPCDPTKCEKNCSTNLNEANAHAPTNMGQSVQVQQPGLTRTVEKVSPKAKKEADWNNYEQLANN